ncbi:MAG TPA: Rieske 2Fe-2S domain-containing protein [Beijerinckiaceae bacterium]|jgi:nitrite reductase/ring-hydroxylating ferredoxin subunit|nr:Rieske 2Fe-2S domain-containing protein [Beijerinckiaceae bacterium]
MKPEENERLTRVGAGTPGGDMMRRYWQPILLETEITEVDGPPVRVRLLGQDLIAFRDSDGKVGLLDAYCPHRRAPLFFGRNEECGLRCVYHGWKFNRNGDCVDMPSEPEGTPLQARVKIAAYPTYEGGGLVWAYLGPKDKMPPPPSYEWMRAPATHRFVSKTFQNSNYLQGLEGGLDTAHVGFLHTDERNPVTSLSARDRQPRLGVDVTDYGYYYTSHRRIAPEQHYIRIYQYIMPAQQMRPSVVQSYGKRQDMPTIDGHIWAPIDDEHTFVYNIIYSFDPATPLDPHEVAAEEAFFGRGPDDYIPGTFHLKRNAGNDYLVDRALQKQGNFSGITGINTQDMALQECMGPIVDRSKEFLGTTDRAIVTMRRLMLEAISTVEQGGVPRGIYPDQHGGARAYDDIVDSSVPMTKLLEEAAAKW